MKIFTSVSTIPPRQENLRVSLESIAKNQTVLPDMTILNVCSHYHRFPTQTIDIKNIPSDMKNLVVNTTTDDGPLTKILGFLDFYAKNISSEKDDILIIHDDDLIYEKSLIERLTSPIIHDEKDVTTHLYDKGLKMYSTDMEDDVVKSNFVYPCFPGYLGICFKINQKIVKDFKAYIQKIVEKIPESKYHDDAIITSYLRSRNNRILWYKMDNIVQERPDLKEDTNSLCSRDNEQKNRDEISYKILEFINEESP